MIALMFKCGLQLPSGHLNTGSDFCVKVQETAAEFSSVSVSFLFVIVPQAIFNEALTAH